MTEPLFPEPDERHVQVVLPVPLRRRFTYRVPAPLAERVVVGSRVAVPFGARKLPGFVVGTQADDAVDHAKLRDVAGLLERDPVFPAELLAFLVEAADYYLHPLGEVLRAAAPAMPAEAMRGLRERGFLAVGEELPGARIAMRTEVFVRKIADRPEPPRLGRKQRAALVLIDERGELSIDELRRHVKEPRAVVRALVEKGLATTEERQVPSDPFFGAPVAADVPPVPSAEQRVAIDAIVSAVTDRAPRSFLLHGITGSGKTEVYLRAIAEARALGLGALVLVPEIALTPQLVSRFRARFGDAIAVLHSGLGDRERHLAWQALRTGVVHVAIGARSALFAPVQALGIVVVDEEHDTSFKQEEGFRYHARDLAMLRAHRAGAVCVLGSATPSIESYHLAVEQKRIGLLTLPNRATPRSLPEVELVDLARHRSGPSGHPLITAPLHRALERCLADQAQAILFLNRRGFSPSMRCRSCSAVAQCPACSVALTEHRRARVLRCHYCDFAAPVSEACTACGALDMEAIGVGTERLEEALASTFAPARVARLDRDTASGEGVEAVLERMRTREIDILVGTQMVTKGHDLPGVTLVGVVLADQSLAFPDFRASERTFQLLAQVAGRAGRGEASGRVVLQTYQPLHSAIVRACTHDYLGFYRDELAARRELGYAPFSRLIAIRVDAVDPSRARATAELLADIAKRQPQVQSRLVSVLGPAPAPIERLRGRYRHRFLLRSADRKALRRVGAAVAARIDEGVGPARASVDVDPVSML